MGGREDWTPIQVTAWEHAFVYEYVGEPLTKESLAALLDRLGVQPATYSLYGAHSPETHVMDRRPEGWVVFYTERGDESNLVTYTTEADACLALLERVTSEDDNFFELVAGPALPDVADNQFQAWLDERSLSQDRLTRDDWKTQDSPWVANRPDYGRYWVRTAAVRRLQRSVLTCRVDAGSARWRSCEMNTAQLLPIAVGDDPTLRLAVAAYLARYKGQSRIHTESDLRAYLDWSAQHDVTPLEAQRAHLELYLRWMQEIRHYKPSTVSRRLSVLTGFYRTCVVSSWSRHAASRSASASSAARC